MATNQIKGRLELFMIFNNYHPEMTKASALDAKTEDFMKNVAGQWLQA